VHLWHRHKNVEKMLLKIIIKRKILYIKNLYVNYFSINEVQDNGKHLWFPSILHHAQFCLIWLI